MDLLNFDSVLKNFVFETLSHLISASSPFLFKGQPPFGLIGSFF